MKYIKVILVILVVLGLVLSYVLFGFRTPRRARAPTKLPTQETEIDFKGPTAPPSVKGPTSSPPVP